MNTKVLLVDDEPEILSSTSLMLRKSNYTVLTSTTIESAQQTILNEKPDVIVTDLKFHGQEKDGLDLINWVIESNLSVPVLVLSGESDVSRALTAKNRILDDYLLKPFEISDLICAIEKAKARVEAERQRPTHALHDLKSRDPKILRALQEIKNFMESDSKLVLCLYGESGSGKEEFAKYAASVIGGDLIAVNMAAIPRETAESELFGHVKGAFTGAISDKAGKFQAANDGVLFLDEIGDCPLDLQVKLFRALQERQVNRVGSNKVEKINAKIIVATNQDLKAKVKQGTFREELLYRVEGLPIVIPPLRDRKDDIPLLVGKFLLDLSPKARPATITQEALNALSEYSWPGNVRELRNTVEKAMLAGKMREIDLQHLPPAVQGMPQLEVETTREPEENLNLEKLLENAEKIAFKRALEKAQGSRKLAMQFLGITETTFFRRARKLGILGSEVRL